MAAPSKEEVLAWMAETGKGAAAASRHFGGKPAAGTIRSWVRRRREALAKEKERARKAPEVRDLSGRVQQALLMAVLRRLQFLASQESIRSPHQQRAAIVMGILLDKFPDLLTFERRLEQASEGESPEAEAVNDDLDGLINALGISREELDAVPA